MSIPKNLYIAPNGNYPNIPDLSFFEDNRTITRYKDIPKKQICFRADMVTDPCCIFNNSKCGNDRDYFQLVCSREKCYCLHFPGLYKEEYLFDNKVPYVSWGNIYGDLRENDFELEFEIYLQGTQTQDGIGVICSKAGGPTVLSPNYWFFGVDTENFALIFQAFKKDNYLFRLTTNGPCKLQIGSQKIKIKRVSGVYSFYINDIKVTYTATFPQVGNQHFPNIIPSDIDTTQFSVPPFGPLPSSLKFGALYTVPAIAKHYSFKGGICYSKITVGSTTEIEWIGKLSYKSPIIKNIYGTNGKAYNYQIDGSRSPYSDIYCSYYKDCDPCNISGCSEQDYLYFQFSVKDNFNDWVNNIVTRGWGPGKNGDWFATVEVLSPYCCNTTYDLYVVNAFVGYVEATNLVYQQIIIDPSELPEIFQLKFTFNQGNCKEISYYSEMYMKANCVNTFKMVGNFDEQYYSCYNYYYGFPDKYLGDKPSRYSSEVRLSGELSFESVETEVEELKTNNVVKRSIIRAKDKYKMRTDAQPEFIINKIKEIMTAENFNVGEKTFKINGTISKNSEMGRMWFLDVDVERISEAKCALEDFTCSKVKKPNN